MSDFYFDPKAFTTISNTLEDAAKGLDGLASGAPNGTDAGLMTGVISSMLAQVMASAAAVSSVLTASAGTAAEAQRYYTRVDADQAASLEKIHKEMQR